MRHSSWNVIGCVILGVTLLGCNGSPDTSSAEDTSQGADSGDSTGDDTEAKSETEKIEDEIPIPKLN